MSPELAAWLVPLRHTHVSLVMLSVALFALRGGASLAGAAWPAGRTLRRAVILIDTALLASGASLWWLLGLHPGVQTWLGLKLALLLVYIALGSVALRASRLAAATPPGTRATWFSSMPFWAYLAALATVALMAGIALAHHPAGWWLWWGLAGRD